MISTQYTEQAQAIPYPRLTDRDARAAARKVYDREHAIVTAAFAAALADEYLADIAEPRRANIAARTFALAWEHGHSSGYGEVENYYIDFAAFALQVYAVATS